MKLILEKDDGEEEVFQYVTDLYIAMRQEKVAMRDDGKTAILPETRSYSWGGNIRELQKELRQSVEELQLYLNDTTRISKK